MGKLFQATGGKIAVVLLDEEETTPGGIVIPDSAKDKAHHKRGEVQSVGTGVAALDGQRIALPVWPGLTIHFWVHEDHQQIEVDGVKLYVIDEGNVLGHEIEN